ncbi:hypothetical protein G7Z17_g6426 [Cylindrodendrum hubeiense]|uniref:Uncharacterized protein n=1 Tax=Cylindrodendrum hubeiense TaxID=595255 RepID=A0A9P5LGT5_9HYPO|nr:hypothetical protein G7Z17_g6426 [Cylindrodendrum hubeiense]
MFSHKLVAFAALSSLMGCNASPCKAESTTEVAVTTTSTTAEPTSTTDVAVTTTSTTAEPTSTAPTRCYFKIDGGDYDGQYLYGIHGDAARIVLGTARVDSEIFTLEEGTSYLKLGDDYPQAVPTSNGRVTLYVPPLSSLAYLVCNFDNYSLQCARSSGTTSGYAFSLSAYSGLTGLNWVQENYEDEGGEVTYVNLKCEEAGES